ncbi:glycoside hydrolase family 127 protein [Bifidobacterium amazonense]|uniref:Glycoside hydrolase family 127 protein n=1 Tax=Bifidobacterium amazonense TaxID=2809027 RepID=A0ABS9VXZ5_9BIFI|nr:beta-L-arabinofuranosidase domain-containing protein [Bifidobacterium amazonense]MCH9276985.1 glycoside hydrolase family 127 protein [Bifidobacterium amazonense]
MPVDTSYNPYPHDAAARGLNQPEPEIRPAVEPRLRSFRYANVALSDGHWKRQRDHVVNLYLSLPDDDILQSALRGTGVDIGARGLGGWGGTFGQMLASFAKLYAVTGDFRLKAKAIDLFERWFALAGEHDELLRLGTYDYEKMLGGLLDMDEIMGYDAQGRVREAVSRLTDAAMRDFDESIPRDGLQDGRMKGQIEWYTLPENLYRAWLRYGDGKYRDYAGRWRYDYLWDKVAARDFASIGPRHAYSHVNALSSLAREYEATGDAGDLDVLRAAYDELLARHTYATGGYGPGENLFVERDGYLGFMLMSPWDLHGEDPTFRNFAGERVARSDAWGSCEVSCCSWAVFKLCDYLLRFTGEARYGAWAERMLLNCVGGQPDIKPNGELLYYANYFADGGMKSTVDRRLQREGQNFRWQCCSGTFPQDVAEYANMLYYADDDALYVTQYLPSSVRWDRGGRAVAVENFSDWPRDGRIRLRVDGGGMRFALRLRVPDWADGADAVRVNGRRVDVPVRPNDWLTVERCWDDGDLLEFDVPYRLRFVPVDDARPDLVALCYGPVVLVSDEMTLLSGDRDRPQDWIVPVEGETMTFRTLPGHAGLPAWQTRTFSPYYLYPQDRWYFMYHRIYADDDRRRDAVRMVNMG